MNDLPHQFREDRALRNAAKAVLDADIAHLKATVQHKGVGGRIRDQVTSKVKQRVSVGARDALAQVKEQASDHRGVIAILVGALILWLGREPLLGWLGLSDTDNSGDDPDDADDLPETEFDDCDQT